MACDPNTLIEQAKCLEACIPPGMMPAVQTSLLCQIADAGGGSGGEFVLKAGDTMSGNLALTAGSLLIDGGISLLIDGGVFFNKPGIGTLSYDSGGAFSVSNAVGDSIFNANPGPPSKIGFFGTAVVQQTSGADLTNNVTAGGVDNTIADFTSLTVYTTDGATIRNDIYQLARKLKQINDGLRAYGLFT